ncbi:DNA cytosine methyltransferase [Methylocystis sp. SC2]|uniref:DNA cytosine methyltransferase n=1 Tax=Methylocystis sp. (strain SC2) TaxID=187303 RepID=UPI00027AF2C7|nr:DNA cytosine methyltransferase [Methylocystis sp. SC2]CCJ07185.1 Cytosine-specific methyltransferase [Methylocystis sp. SC2]
MDDRPAYYEFFAGGGMARAGLGEGWRCLFANDFDRKKAESYRANWGGEELHVGDVREISTAQLPGRADLVWASFPCQDLSLAGAGAGLKGERSGTFWPFWDLMKALRQESRAPSLIVLENVCGALTSHGGKDFVKICEALAKEGYRFGALVIDAALFVPQSRPRLFIIAAREDVAAPSALTRKNANAPFHTRALVAAHERLPNALQDKWHWWNLPAPPLRNTALIDVIEDAPTDVEWRSVEETIALIAMMSDVNLAKIAEAKRAGRKMVGTLYRRTRYQNGVKIQRAEARFDEIAGCLRTPAGGSSRQYVLVVNKGRVRSRLMSARETARLMGLPENYSLPATYSDAYHLTGDGVVVPVVRHIAASLLEPLLNTGVVQEAA